MASREKLIEHFNMVLFEFEAEQFPDAKGVLPDSMPPNRLTVLLQQAVEQQVQNNHYHPGTSRPRITTLLQDYRCFVVPNAIRRRFVGHKSNVKCVEFVGVDGSLLATGSSDNTVRLWDTESGRPHQVLEGHRSRVWDLSASAAGDLLASASGDATVKLWRRGVVDADAAALAGAAAAGGPAEDGGSSGGGGGGGAHTWGVAATLTGARNDVYTVSFHPNGHQLVSGGYDQVVRLYDIERGNTVLKMFEGHQALVSRAVFSPHGKLLITGSKDGSIRIWDILSGAGKLAGSLSLSL